MSINCCSAFLLLFFQQELLLFCVPVHCFRFVSFQLSEDGETQTYLASGYQSTHRSKWTHIQCNECNLNCIYSNENCKLFSINFFCFFTLISIWNWTKWKCRPRDRMRSHWRIRSLPIRSVDLTIYMNLWIETMYIHFNFQYFICSFILLSSWNFAHVSGFAVRSGSFVFVFIVFFCIVSFFLPEYEQMMIYRFLIHRIAEWRLFGASAKWVIVSIGSSHVRSFNAHLNFSFFQCSGGKSKVKQNNDDVMS